MNDEQLPTVTVDLSTYVTNELMEHIEAQLTDRLFRLLKTERDGFDEWAKTVENRIREIRDEQIRQRVDALLDDVFEETWTAVSERDGSSYETSLRKRAADLIDKALKERFESNRNPYEWSPFAKAVSNEINRQLGKEFKEALTSAKAELVALMRDKAAETMAAMLVNVAGIK